MKAFIIGRIKSIKFAVKGFFILLKTEHAIMAQVSFGILATVLGLYLGISRLEWIAQLLAIGIVLTAESLNTAIESICDFVHPDYHEKIGRIKDISAGAVTFAALTALCITGFIYFPYLF